MTTPNAAPIGHHQADISAEDEARAHLYALLASLFYRAPDASLLAAMATGLSVDGDGPLPMASQALAKASAETSATHVQEEHEALFVGMGRAPVLLYASYYLAGFLMEKPLAQLRTDLASLGFERHAEAHESEDHLSALCDVMRLLIMQATPMASQKDFFVAHLHPWVGQCCAAIQKNEKSDYYRIVARLASVFFALEAEAFTMDH